MTEADDPRTAEANARALKQALMDMIIVEGSPPFTEGEAEAIVALAVRMLIMGQPA